MGGLAIIRGVGLFQNLHKLGGVHKLKSEEKNWEFGNWLPPLQLETGEYDTYYVLNQTSKTYYKKNSIVKVKITLN